MGSSMFEPSADMRQMAKVFWDMYSACLQEEFNEEQALRLVLRAMEVGHP